MSSDCGDELYFISQICYYNQTVHDSDSLIACLSEQASDKCRDPMCVTMDQAGFPCTPSQGNTEKKLQIIFQLKQ